MLSHKRIQAVFWIEDFAKLRDWRQLPRIDDQDSVDELRRGRDWETQLRETAGRLDMQYERSVEYPDL